MAETTEAPVALERPASEQIAFVHILRGVAALLVVWAHLSGYWLSTVGRTDGAQTIWYEWVVRPFHLYQNGGHLGVILFFLISGYIITHTSLREDRRSFAVKRVLRIFPALIAALLLSWLVITVATAVGLHPIGLHAGPWWRWVEAAFLLDGFTAPTLMLDVTWTLVVELIFYVLVFAFLGRQRRRPLATTAFMAAIWFAASIVFLNIGHLSQSANGWTMFWVGFLLVGRIIYLVQRRLASALDGAILGSSILIGFALLAEAAEPGHLLSPGGYTGYEPMVTYLIAILLFVGLLRIAPKRAIQPFRFFGDISYSLYLVHLPFGLLLISIFDPLGLPESLTSLLAIVGSIALAAGFWLAIERPSQRLARRILKARFRPTPPEDQPTG